MLDLMYIFCVTTIFVTNVRSSHIRNSQDTSLPCIKVYLN